MRICSKRYTYVERKKNRTCNARDVIIIMEFSLLSKHYPPAMCECDIAWYLFCFFMLVAVPRSFNINHMFNKINIKRLFCQQLFQTMRFDSIMIIMLYVCVLLYHSYMYNNSVDSDNVADARIFNLKNVLFTLVFNSWECTQQAFFYYLNCYIIDSI